MTSLKHPALTGMRTRAALMIALRFTAELQCPEKLRCKTSSESAPVPGRVVSECLLPAGTPLTTPDSYDLLPGVYN